MPGIRKTRTASAYRDLRQMEAWGASFGEVKGDVNSAIAFRLEPHPFIRSSALSTSKNKREIDFWLHWTLAFTEHGRARCSTSSRHVTSSTSANILVWSHMASEWIYDAPYVSPIRSWLKSPGVACEAVVCRWNRYWRRRTTLLLESDDELELGAPKRYEKLYLVTVSKSKSGLWQTAKVRSCRRRTWRSCEGCRTSLESCEDEKAKTRRSPWRVGAHERLKSNYDCDLVVDVLEDSISLQEVLIGSPGMARRGRTLMDLSRCGAVIWWSRTRDRNHDEEREQGSVQS